MLLYTVFSSISLTCPETDCRRHVTLRIHGVVGIVDVGMLMASLSK